MNRLKKLASLVLALVMAFALAAPAFASGDGGEETETPPAATAPAKGSITVKNASKGETYKLVKLFDMTFGTDGKSYAYTGTIPDSLTDYFEYVDPDAAPPTNIKAKDAATGADGKLSAAAVTAIKTWAESQTAIQTETAEGSELVFENLAYGYYVVVSRGDNASGGAISVDSTAPDATIFDKNKDELTNPEKQVKDGNGNVIQTAAVGETVTYVVTLDTLNWIGQGDAAKQVISYKVEDTLPDFLTNVTVTGIKVTEKKADGTDEDATLSVQQFDATSKSFTIAWADQGDLICEETHAEHTDACYEWTSKYDNGAKLTITYTAVVTEKILEEGDGNHKNTVTITPNYTDGSGTPVEDEEDLYTATIVIDKYTGEGDAAKKLAGAEFVLMNSDGKYYKWDTETEPAKVTWVDDETAADKVTTDENGAASFRGLDAGTYKLKETKAPDGYNKLNDPVEIVIEEKETVAGTGDEGETTTTDTLTKNISLTKPVENNTGAQLPSTGGIGTTIFYIVGGVLAAGAVILLITKRRMNIDK